MGRLLTLLTTASLLALLAASAAAAPGGTAGDGATADPLRNEGNTPAGPFDTTVTVYTVSVDIEPLDDDDDGDGVPTVTGIEKEQIKRGMVIASAAKKGDRVALIGFDALSSDQKGRNPETGKEIKIPASRTEKDGGRHTPFHDRYRPAVADLDGDGHPDLLVLSAHRTGSIVTLTGLPLPTGHPGTDTALERCGPATNGEELVEAIATAADITKADAKRTLAAFLHTART